MRKARKTPVQGSFKVCFDETGRVKSFAIKGEAADQFYRGLQKLHAKCTCKQGLLPCPRHDWESRP